MKYHVVMLTWVVMSSTISYGMNKIIVPNLGLPLPDIITHHCDGNMSPDKNFIASSESDLMFNCINGKIICFLDPDKHIPCENMEKGLASYLLYLYKNEKLPKCACHMWEFTGNDRTAPGKMLRVTSPRKQAN